MTDDRRPDGPPDGTPSGADAARRRALRADAAPVPSPRTVARRPSRARNRAVGVVLVLVLAVIGIGSVVAVVAKSRQDAAAAARVASSYTPAPPATPTPRPSGPVIAVVGDDVVTRAASSVSAGERWAALLRARFGGAISSEASTGMGYTVKGSSGRTFVGEASRVPSDADVVVFIGGSADAGGSSLALAKAATAAISSAARQAPDARIVVVGPLFGGLDLAGVRSTLRGASGIANARWVDPVEAGWFVADRAAASADSLTSADERRIADELRPVMTRALL